MSLGSGLVPHYLLGNPFGPVPYDAITGTRGKFFYMNEYGHRIGPFDTYEEAKADKELVVECSEKEKN